MVWPANALDRAKMGTNRRLTAFAMENLSVRLILRQRASPATSNRRAKGSIETKQSRGTRRDDNKEQSWTVDSNGSTLQFADGGICHFFFRIIFLGGCCFFVCYGRVANVPICARLLAVRARSDPFRGFRGGGGSRAGGGLKGAEAPDGRGRFSFFFRSRQGGGG